MIKFELAELPQISNIKKIEDKFLPDNLVKEGYIYGSDDDPYAIGPKSAAGRGSISINGLADEYSAALGPGSTAQSRSIAITSDNPDDYIISASFEKTDTYYTIKVSLDRYDVYDFIWEKGQKCPITLQKNAINDTEYFNEKIIYPMEIKDIVELEDGAEIYLYNYNLPWSNLKNTGTCIIICSGYANNNSVLLGQGYANQQDFVSNVNAYGSKNIAIYTGNDHIFTPPTIAGSENIALRSGDVSGDNNIILNSLTPISGNNNIQIGSNLLSNNNSIHIGINNVEATGITSQASPQYDSDLGRYRFKLTRYSGMGTSQEVELIKDRIYWVRYYNGGTEVSTTASTTELFYLRDYVPYDTSYELFFENVLTGIPFSSNYGTYRVSLTDLKLVENEIVIGYGNYANANNQIILGSYAKPNEDSYFVIGNGQNASNRKNLLEVNKKGVATIESLEIRNTNNEASYTSQDCMVLRDVDTGWEYAYQMKSGALVTILLPTHIEATKLPDKLEYEQGDSLNPSEIEITAFYPDGTSQFVTDFEILPINNRDFLYDIGLNKVTIRAKLPLSYFTNIEVNVIEFDYETALIDFNYTINSDGTITLNSWKQTLNGEPSTEMIIPNNGLIII